MINREMRSVKVNELIFTEGQSGDCAYLIESGHILTFVNKDQTEIPLKVLGPGEVFGEMSLIDNSLRSASCRALEDCRLITVTREQLLSRIKSADPVVRLLMHALLERLRWQNAAMGGKAVSNENLADQENERREVIARIEQENRISRALQNDEFIPFYQPIFHLATGQIAGAEALIRWKSPDGLITAPSQFIFIMEESSLILRAGQIMIEKAMYDLSHDLKSLPEDFFISVNVSGKQFAEPNFLEHLEENRLRYKLDAQRIKLEVTEAVMMEGPQAVQTLQACRSRGYKLAVDDFGTGFSSLQYLASMPLTDLKIDRSFVIKMLTHEKSLTVVTALIQMARLLDLNVIAEGIELEDQRSKLQKLGVTMGQGYLLSKPLSCSDLKKFIDQRGSQAA
jgi:EAL domain-containing protein (putative c-di-GMP-specific phosphodiesterase class I)